MNRTSKGFAVFIILIMAISSLSLIMVEPVSAQTIPKPSVPQFSIQVVDYSYDVPTKYSTDSYTGKQTTIPGYHVDDIRVEGKIKNQHFTPYIIPNPNSTSNHDANLNIDFYYNIRYKGHFGSESEWMKLVGTRDVDFLIQNYDSEYTNFTVAGYDARMFEEGAAIDFQVKAFIGFETWGFVGTFPYRILNGEESGWSNTQTLTISKDATSSNTYVTNIDSSPYPTIESPQTFTTPTPTSIISETPSPTPTVPEFPFFIGVATALMVLALALSVFKRRGIFK